jgi:chromosome segregation ATPase
MKYNAVVLTLGLLIVAIGSAVRINASQGAGRQGAGPQEDVLPALIVEVRGLRAAMEQMASAGPRVQLALGRVQLQEQRVNTLMRRLEDGRGHLAETQRKYEQMQQQLRGIETSLREPVRLEGPSLADFQAMQRETERELARFGAEIQRMTAETTVMESDLATEQGRWIELNQRMEALEQSLVRR